MAISILMLLMPRLLLLILLVVVTASTIVTIVTVKSTLMTHDCCVFSLLLFLSKLHCGCNLLAARDLFIGRWEIAIIVVTIVIILL